MTYQEKLKDPRWQKKRLKILERDGFMCRFCENSDEELHVHHMHHMRYLPGAAPWEHPDESLKTLCKSCHTKVTEIMVFAAYYASLNWGRGLKVLTIFQKLKADGVPTWQVGKLLLDLARVQDADPRGREV